MKGNLETVTRPASVSAQGRRPQREKVEPLAEFRLGDQLYQVFSDPILNHQIKDVVGKFKVDFQRYLIVRAERPFKSDSFLNPGSSVDILTRRELQIVMLVAEGRVDKQIASQLKISPWTVNTYLRRIFAKLKVDSRAAMVYQCSSRIGKV
jgi:DNA-binding CsgD family transcriptional regulator